MMNFLITTAVLLLSVLCSGYIVFRLRPGSRWLKLILSFSGAYLLSITVLHLIPSVYSQALPFTGVFILIGFFIQIFLELFSEGIEHGHVHGHTGNERAFPVAMMLALSVHSFLEGMPLAQKNPDISAILKNPLLAGIVLHNIPIAMALTGMLLAAGMKKSYATVWLFLFAAMTPSGMLTGNLIGFYSAGNYGAFSNYILAAVIGIFLHVSTTILFETGEEHRFSFGKIAAIICGIAGAAISLMG